MLDQATHEPRWVTKVHRLFPHPLFAGTIGLACLAVGGIFTIGTLVSAIQGKLIAIFLAGVASVFAGGAFAIFRAMVVRRRYRRRKQAGTNSAMHLGNSESVSTIVAETTSRPQPAVATSHLLLYLAGVYIVVIRIGVAVLTGFFKAKIPPAIQYSLSAAFVLVTILLLVFGKQDIERIRSMRGQFELTNVQALLVVTLLVLIVGSGVATFAVLNG